MMRLSFAVLLIACAASAAPVPADPTPRDREGYPLPKGATARLGSVTFRAPGARALRFSADGTALHALDDARVLAWDARTGAPRAHELIVPKGTAGPWSDAVAGARAFHIEQLPRGNGDGPLIELVVRARGTGAELARVSLGGEYPASLAGGTHAHWLRADGARAVLPTDKDSIAVLDTGTGKRLFALPSSGAHRRGTFSGDGRTVFVTDGAGPVRRCDADTGKNVVALAGTDKNTESVVTSADGTLAVTRAATTGSARDVFERFLRVHDVTANKVLHTLDVGGLPREFAVAGPGAVFVLRYADWPERPLAALARWDARTGKKEWERAVPIDLDCLAVAPDGKRVALLHRRRVVHTFDGTTGAPAEHAGHAEPIRWIGWSPDGRTVRTAAGDGALTWNLKGERLSAARPDALRTASFATFAPGGAPVFSLPSANGRTWELAAWDFEKGALAWRVPVGPVPPRSAFSADGRRATVALWNQAAKKWDVTTFDGPAGKVARATRFDAEGPNDPGESSTGLALSADGARLYLARASVRALDTASGKVGPFAPLRGVNLEDTAQPPTVAVSPDGARVAFVPGERELEARVPDQFLSVFDARTGTLLAEHNTGSASESWAAFNPTGSRVAVWNTSGLARVYRADARADPLDLSVPSLSATCAAFSPDGARLAVGYIDGTALIWDAGAKPKE